MLGEKRLGWCDTLLQGEWHVPDSWNRNYSSRILDFTTVHLYLPWHLCHLRKATVNTVAAANCWAVSKLLDLRRVNKETTLCVTLVSSPRGPGLWLVSGRTKTLVWELWLAAETVLEWAMSGCTRTFLVVSSEKENWLLWETFTLGTRTVIQFCFKKITFETDLSKSSYPSKILCKS